MPTTILTRARCDAHSDRGSHDARTSRTIRHRSSQSVSDRAEDRPARGHSRGPRRAWHSPLAWLTLVGAFAAGLASDLGTKAWSFRTVGEAPIVLDREALTSDGAKLAVPLASRRVLPGRLLDFKLVLNPGAVFGIGANHRWFFIAFTGVALVGGVLVFGRFSASGAWPAHAALGLVMSGGVGNLHDRITFGRVRDFIQLLPGRHLPFDWTWPGTQNPEMFPWVFNLADVWLFVGMIALMVYLDRVQKATKSSDDAEESDKRPEPRNDEGEFGPVADGAP